MVYDLFTKWLHLLIFFCLLITKFNHFKKYVYKKINNILILLIISCVMIPGDNVTHGIIHGSVALPLSLPIFSLTKITGSEFLQL